MPEDISPVGYDAYYFANCTPPGLPYERTDHWLRFFGNIAEHIANEIVPRRSWMSVVQWDSW